MVEMAHTGDDKIGDMTIVFVYAHTHTQIHTHTHTCVSRLWCGSTLATQHLAQSLALRRLSINSC